MTSKRPALFIAYLKGVMTSSFRKAVLKCSTKGSMITAFRRAAYTKPSLGKPTTEM